MTEAQKRAHAKYKEKNRKTISIGFYSEREAELYDWCKRKGTSQIKQILWDVKSREQGT